MDETALRREFEDTLVGDALLAVHAEDGRAPYQTVMDAVNGDRSDAAQVVRRMRETELTEGGPKMSFQVNLTGRGKRVAQAVQKSRASGEARVNKVHLAMLEWLAGGGSPAEVLEFVGQSGATAYGVPFTPDEVQDSSDYLTEENFIKSSDAWGISSGIRPEITSKGKRALNADVPLTQFTQVVSGPSQSYDYSNRTTVTADTVGAVQTGGSENVQSVTLDISTDQRDQITREVSDILRQLDEAGVEESEPLRGALQAVKSEAETGTKDSLKDKIVAAMASAVGSETTKFALQSLALMAGGLVT